MKRYFFAFLTVLTAWTSIAAQEVYGGTVVADEGAWCWFADPRALHYENEGGTINATYIGYIDVHGNVMATQYDWVKKHKTDVLVRSFFQPDDHNNPTFVVLPDERVMIFYTRHTDEAKIWYRISRKPGDITALGEEKYLATANNTTYPSPFILSDDPNHIYLCWRGINWHPTIARLTMPEASDNCSFDFGPITYGKRPLLWCLLLVVIEWLQRHRSHPLQIDALPSAVRWAIYYALFFVVFFARGEEQAFIYFQF